MSLTLEIVSRHRQTLGAKAVMTFGQDGGTIGRSLDTNWALPDSQRFLSSRHASIDFRSGSYYIVDTSKNGVYINDAEQPVGRGTPQRLFPGDRIRIGEYEMVVSIENVDDTRESLLSTSHVDPVDLKQRVEAPEPTGRDLVDAHVITGVGIEMFIEDDDAETLTPLHDKFRTGDSSSRIEQAAKPAAPAPKRPAAQTKPASASSKPATASRSPDSPSQSIPALSLAPETPRPENRAAASRAAAAAAPRPAQVAAPRPARVAAPRAMPGRPAAGATASGSLEAFFRGAGIEAPKLEGREAEQLMLRLGQVTREFLVGMIECLHMRALQKAQLKQSNTTIQARDNNRLKFSANVEEGFERLFFDDAEQYMEPVESVRGAFADIKGHQRALLRATRRALDEYLDRLEPETLELRAANGRTGTLINAANKLRYWDLYKDVYAILANRPQNELPQPFLDALANAYEQETEKPKKDDAADQSREAV